MKYIFMDVFYAFFKEFLHKLSGNFPNSSVFENISEDKNGAQPVHFLIQIQWGQLSSISLQFKVQGVGN